MATGSYLDVAGVAHFFTKLCNVFGKTKKVNGITPDETGNVKLETISKAISDQNGHEISSTYATKQELAQASMASSVGIISGVSMVNSIRPDKFGNVEIDVIDKAMCDQYGNTISSTYVSNAALNDKLALYPTMKEMWKAVSSGTVISVNGVHPDQEGDVQIKNVEIASSAGVAQNATCDSIGRVITTTYATKEDLKNLSPSSGGGGTVKAVNGISPDGVGNVTISTVANATRATNATYDGTGNEISSFYATKTELEAVKKSISDNKGGGTTPTPTDSTGYVKNVSTKVKTGDCNLLVAGGTYIIDSAVTNNPANTEGYLQVLPGTDTDPSSSTCAQLFIAASTGVLYTRTSYWQEPDYNKIAWRSWNKLTPAAS
jgi:hypothetical protein